MGAIFFSVDRAAVELLAGSLGLSTFVETGTFHGDSLAGVRDLFTTLHSAEIDPVLATAAEARFHADAGITIHQASSPDMLRTLHASPLDRVFYWLDAHWCESAGADPAGQCPLLAEIAAIGTAGPNSVIAIDDARLFLAPPTAAHVIGDWPHFEEVLARLQRAAPDHHILVLNDVIWTVPGAAFDTMLDYAARHGADWLAIAEKARTYDAVIVQLREKDREINALTAENQARLELVDRLNSTLAQISKERSVKEPTREFENQIAALQAVAEERAELITTLDATARSAGERAALADFMRDHIRAESAARLDELAAQSRLLEEERQRLLTRAQTLEAAAADLTGQIVAATGRADALEQIAVERSALIDRLDELARERAAALASWQARALAAEQQLVDVTAAAADADSRAQNAERECDARQVVIEELVRARDAFSAALAPRAQPLEAAAADLTGQIVAATGRADALEQIAVERSALIDRLDELARERAAALASWQARALAAEQQLVDVTAVAADAASRAQNAERECDARQVVIEELVRARDAFSAALATGPRPTRLGRLFFRNSP